MIQINAKSPTNDSIIIFIKNGDIYFDMLVDHTGTRIAVKDNKTKSQILELLMQMEYKKRKV